MQHIVFLEGNNELAFKIHHDRFKELGYEVDAITGLYDNIKKLGDLEHKQPDTLFIGNGSGLRDDRREELIEQFSLLKYRPKNVIFPTESEVFKYMNIVKALHQQGVKFYLYWLTYNEFKEIEWIDQL